MEKGGSNNGQIFTVASVNAEIDRESELSQEVPPFPAEKGGMAYVRRPARERRERAFRRSRTRRTLVP